MTKTLEERIAGISRKKYKREGGLGKMDALIMTLKKEARGELAMITVDLAVELRDYISESLELLNFIAELQAENQALQKKLEEGSKTRLLWRKAIVRQLKAARKERDEALGWQPIETAPKDGTRFCASNGKETYTTWWQSYYEKWPHDEGGPTFRYQWTCKQNTSHSFFYEKPTHWMPLPEAPKLNKQGVEDDE